ncbi:Transposon protein [Phytophthora megakarya]|uniref:Transposon protein n=1 Tax=Phytophthora megakarya TaxID=4795 RepID=A0A225WQ54_9STRA|nr:Transposon protein [Phytophthora megakarya]
MNNDSAALACIRKLHDDDTSALDAVMLAYASQNDEPPRPQGSVAGRKLNFYRGAEDAHAGLKRDYFAEFPVYSPRIFRRRFRMQKSLYLRICTAAIRQLAYSVPADVVDDYVRIGESTTMESVLRFCGAVIDLFGQAFSRAPMDATCNVYSPCMCSVDLWECVEVWSERKNCPVAWTGQYKGKEKKPTMVLEAVMSSDLWI